MKRFVDYNPTNNEIANIFGTEELYKFKLERFDRYPGDDYEKLNIAASLLSIRGEREESLVPRCFKWVRGNFSCARRAVA